MVFSTSRNWLHCYLCSVIGSFLFGRIIEAVQIDNIRAALKFLDSIIAHLKLNFKCPQQCVDQVLALLVEHQVTTLWAMYR